VTVPPINSLNVFLIAISLAAALIVPFDVFLLSYAILGPLHYLTEISWLHDREYFVSGHQDWIPLWLLGLAGAAFTPGVFSAEPLVLRIPWLGEMLNGARFDIGFLALGVALAFVVTQKIGARLAILAAVLIALQIYRTDSTFVRIFAVYLPTVIHVFIFTGLFMISGALKSRSHSGIGPSALFCLRRSPLYSRPHSTPSSSRIGVENISASPFIRSRHRC
jgi:hypothetical protein